MKPYYEMLNAILESGEDRGDRTGVDTRSIFGYQARYKNIGEQFPLDTTREINFRQIVGELLWFLKGNTNIQELVKQGFHLWTDWPYKRYCQIVEKRIREGETNLVIPSRADFNERIRTDNAFAEKYGDCGPVYGKQWRAWDTFSEAGHDGCIDQIANLVEDLKKNPLSCRHIVSAWNVADIPAMIPSGLPPCHALFQFYCSQLTLSQREKLVDYDAGKEWSPLEQALADNSDLTVESALDKLGIPKYRLHCQLYQRSCDSTLGASYNIPSYSLLTMMLAQQVNMIPGDFIHSLGDAHIYSNHFEALQHQLARRPRKSPTVKIRKAKDIFSYTIDDFDLIDYDPHPPISYKIAV